jgi:hypothetical protein
MLSLFALPKGFAGHTALIQKNALRSWTLLKPQPDIILFGNDPGVAEAAEEFGLRYCPDVVRNNFGTPLVSDLFARAQDLARHNPVCYINSDIILLSDFMASVERLKGWRGAFLLAGRRWNLDLREPLAFAEGWEDSLRERARAFGELQDPWWIDYFVFTRGLWKEMPPFAIGRPAWDNWLIYDARRRKIPVVDATECITAIHQKHDYTHVPQSTGDHWRGPESEQNLILAGGPACTLTLLDATHRLSGKRIVRKFSLQPLYRALDRLALKGGPLGSGVSFLRATARRLRDALTE